LSLGKYNEAIVNLEKSLRIIIEISNKRIEGTAYLNLGNVYLLLGKYSEAIEYHEKSLNIAIEIGDKTGEATNYMNLGNTNLELGKTHEAVKYYMKSLNVAIETGDKKGEGTTYMNLGNAYLSIDEYQEAIKYYEKSLNVAKEICNKKGEGLTYTNLGNVYFFLDKYHEAIKYCEKGLHIAIEIGDKHNEARANYSLGFFYHDLSMNEKSVQHEKSCQQTKQQSIECLVESLRCWDWMFEHLPEQDDFKISIVDTFIITYKRLATVLIETQQIEEALLVCDRGRARALGDLLTAKYGITKENTCGSTQLEFTDITAVSSNCNVCIVFFALLVNKGLGIWVAIHEKPLIFMECKDEGLNHSIQVLGFKKVHKKNNDLPFIKEVNDAYYKMKVRQAVRCENRSLELPHNSQQQIFSDDQNTAENSLLPSAEINIPAVEDDEIGSKHTDPLDILFNKLVGPVLQNLDKEEIVIIPEGPLYKVPFAALRDPNTGLFLSETKRIRLAPSLTTLKTLQECPADYHCTKGALIVGGPHVGEVIYRGEKTTINNLPLAEHEAKIIGGILNVKPLIGSQATKEIIKQKLREGVAVIHIAAHGNPDGEIALAPPTQTETTSIPEEQDYMLTMKEVQEITVRAQLVVLSCCHSGRGEIKSEGVIAMSRAFLAAGARAVVASLWAINDDATRNFMLSFYMHLKMGDSASKSLQQAMKEMREEGYEEPRHWAPFFLIGDDVTISV
jgi:CHAT domain-containing protein/tetratricopeptide (TPR) repeat protein